MKNKSEWALGKKSVKIEVQFPLKKRKMAYYSKRKHNKINAIYIYIYIEERKKKLLTNIQIGKQKLEN